MDTTPWWSDQRLHDWWLDIILAARDERIRYHHVSAAEQADERLCNVCRSIDFAYAFFGSLELGMRDRNTETCWLGLYSKISERAKDGCLLCSHLIVPNIERLYQAHKDYFISQDLTVHNLLVCLTASESHFGRDTDPPQRASGLYLGAGHPDSSYVSADSTGDTSWTDTPPRFSLDCPRPFTLTDHPLSKYRVVGENIDFYECKSWVDNCNAGHSCSLDIQPYSSPYFKLIDVSSNSLIQPGEAEPQRYAILSYVWGDPRANWKLSKANSSWMTSSSGRRYLSLPDRLPATVADAITVTAKIGLKYLWVDAICITQDDETEKQAQINDMPKIYSNASICIVAASGNDANSGLPGVRQRRIPAEDVGIRISRSLSIGMLRQPVRDLIKSSTWMTRAWTFQEIMLSRRCLIFTEREILFHCGQESLCESSIGPVNDGWRSLTHKGIVSSLALLHEVRTNRDKMSFYRGAMEEYTMRSLTYQSDAMNAFLGVADIVGRVLHSRMSFGIPINILTNCLLACPSSMNVPAKEWPQRRVVTGSAGSFSSSRSVLLPSWAWAAWTGQMAFSAHEYFYIQTQLLTLLPLGLLPGSPLYVDHNLGTHFMFSGTTKQFGEEKVLDISDGILPLFTKLLFVQLVEDEDVPGHAIIYKTTGKDADSCISERCDMRFSGEPTTGHLSLPTQPLALLQLWITSSGDCRALVVKLYPFLPHTNGITAANSGWTHVHEANKQSLKQLSQQQTIIETTAQVNYPTPSVLTKMQSLSHGGEFLDTVDSQGLQIECDHSHMQDKVIHHVNSGSVYLASKVGIAYVNLDKWAAAHPTDAFVLLG